MRMIQRRDVLKVIVGVPAMATLPAGIVSAQVPAGPGVPGFSSVHLDDVVRDFKALFGEHKHMYLHGQFYLTTYEVERMRVVLTQVTTADPFWRLLPDPDKSARDVFGAFDNITSTPGRVPSAADLAMLKDAFPATGPWLEPVLRMFQATSNDAVNDAWAKKWHLECWKGNNTPAAPPWIPDAPSIEHWLAAFKHESVVCYQTVCYMAAKVCAKYGVRKVPPALAINQTLTPQVNFVPPTIDRTARERTSQQLVYSPPGALPTALKRLKDAIDAHVGVVCGLVSGVAYDHSPYPQPEHYIVLIGYDTIEGADAFVFWDPDSERSNIRGPSQTGWGPGFGVLFVSNGRLSTGKTDTDFGDIDRIDSPDSKSFGDHNTQGRRHRYQVWTVETRAML